jgi:organic radical activating enzyme
VSEVRINESFISIQGEGPQAGQRVLFIRLSGCNLKCSFCDSKYASLGLEVSNHAVKKLIRAAADNGIRNVIWTGGEPLLQKVDVLEIVDQTGGIVSHSIETNGTQELSPEECELFDWITVSPKPDQFFHSLSFENFIKEHVEYWSKTPNVIIKPVVGSDSTKWFHWASEQPGSVQERVFFMPQTSHLSTVTKAEMVEGHNRLVTYIVQMMNDYKLACRVSPRLHVIYGVR